MCGHQENSIEIEFAKVYEYPYKHFISNMVVLHPTCSNKIHAEPSHLIAIQTLYKNSKLPPQ